MKHFVFRWIITTVAVMVAASFLNGIHYDSTGSLIGAALLLGILNAFVRPVLLILTAPLILVTLGFFILIVNVRCFGHRTSRKFRRSKRKETWREEKNAFAPPNGAEAA